MKNTGQQATAQHVAANLAYIGRIERDADQHVELEDERGEIIQGRDAIRQIAREWEEHNEKGDDRRKGAVSRSMVLSSPPGSDPQSVLKAAREWGHKELGDRRWVMALHTDTRHPHVHITYAIRDNNLQRSYPKLDVLQKQRESWARELRAVGIEVIATSRKSRGVVKEKENIAETQQRLRGQPREREPSRYLTMMATNRDKVIGVFRSALADLKQSKAPDAPAIAKSLETFVKGLERDAAVDRQRNGTTATPPDRTVPSQRAEIIAEMQDERSHRDRALQEERAPADRTGNPVPNRDRGEDGQSPPARSEERAASASPTPAAPDRDDAGLASAAPGAGRSRAAGAQPAARPERAEEQREIVELGGERFDLSKFDPGTARILREAADEERELNTIELGGETFDLRQYDKETAKIMKEAADEERELNTIELGGETIDLRQYDEETARTMKKAAAEDGERRAETGPKAASAPTKDDSIERVIREMEDRAKERDRDRGGPSR